MARSINKLSARKVETIAKPGRFSDGGNLYLSISPNGGKRWVFLYRWQGRPREMGLGSAARGGVGLARARELAGKARELLSAGINPLDAKRAGQAEPRVPTFGDCSDEFVSSISAQWRNEKHQEQWRTTLTEYAAPLRPLAVNAIGIDDVLRVLKPIWQAKPETASRLRGRIERVLDAARAKGFRSGENPARWRGHLSSLLPARPILSRGHHAAMPYPRVPEFIGRLRERSGTAALALEFIILTAARSGEALGARWSEFDLTAKVWTVPAERMKGAREHRFPLSARAVAIVEDLAKTKTSNFVFPGLSRGKPLTGMALRMVLRRMRVPVTVHGFRSTFRDWCGECTSFPREVAEAALAHVVGDATERAYRRGDALEKRRDLMNAWASYCEPKASSNVVPMPSRRA